MLVGAGGGYDVYCGLPLFHWLRSQGKRPYLASLSFRGGRADLTASGDFLGAFSLLGGMPELDFLARAVDHAAGQEGSRPRIIAGSVVAAAQGRFGNVHVSPCTQGSPMLINPLMAMDWGFRVSITPRPWIELPF